MALDYHEVCPACGATFTVSEIEHRPIVNRFQVRIRVTNTGERGTLDFSASTSVAYVLDKAQAETFAKGIEELPVNQQSGQLIRSNPPLFSLATFVDLEGTSSAKPVLSPGQSWEGWLVYFGTIPADKVALLVRIQTIRSDRGTQTWTSFMEGQPFVRLQPQ